MDSLKWFWGVLLGDFNEDQTMGQIVVGTILTLIPGVDTLADVRDLIANLKDISETPEDAPDLPIKWLALTITLIGFIPAIGSVLKGAFKVFKNMPKGKAAIKAMNEMVAILRGSGYGNPIAYLKNLKWTQLTKKVVDHFVAILEKMRFKIDDIASNKVARYFVGPEKMARLQHISQQMKRLQERGVDQIPKAMKYLRAQVDELIGGIEPVKGKALSGEKTALKNSYADLPIVRAKYVADVKGLEQDVLKMRKAGKPESEIAEYAIAQRRKIQIDARKNTDPEIMELISERNKEAYNHPDGPEFKRTADGRWSYEKQSKTNEGEYDTVYRSNQEAADSAFRSNGSDFPWDLTLEFGRAKKAGDLKRAQELKDKIRQYLKL